MALPTKTEVQTGQFSLDGSPNVNVSAKSAVDADTLEYSLEGSPWWTIDESTPPPATFKPIVFWFT